MTTSQVVAWLRYLGVDAYKRGGFVRIRGQAAQTFTRGRVEAGRYVLALMTACHPVSFHRFERGET